MEKLLNKIDSNIEKIFNKLDLLGDKIGIHETEISVLKAEKKSFKSNLGLIVSFIAMIVAAVTLSIKYL
jgi:hypothetical protein